MLHLRARSTLTSLGRRLCASTLSLTLVATATVVGVSVAQAAPASATWGTAQSPAASPASSGSPSSNSPQSSACTSAPSTSLTLVSVNGQAASKTTNLLPGATLIYRLHTTAACATTPPTPATPMTLSVRIPAGTSYIGTGQGWTVADGIASQTVTVTNQAGISVAFTVRLADQLPTGQAAIIAAASASVGECVCTVSTDLGATITVAKEVVGRIGVADQFTVSLSAAADPATTLASATTSGSTSTARTAAVAVTRGQQYVISEAMAAGSTNKITDYRASLTCVDANGAAVATAGSGPSWTMTPAGPSAYTCTISNAAPPLDCTTGGTLYLVDSRVGTQLVAYDIATRSATPIGSLYEKPSYGLAVSADGSVAYAIDGSGNVVVYSAGRGSFAIAAASVVKVPVTAGAVDPANGLYYFASGPTLYSYDPVAKTVSGPVATLPGAGGLLAFDRAGHGYLETDGTLSLFALPADSSTPVSLAPLATGFLSTATALAFGADGDVYVTGGSNAVARIDPATGVLEQLSPGDAGGLAGCANPYLVSAAVSLPKGLFAPTDQFTVSIGASGAGPVLAQPGASYTVSESATSGELTNYAVKWSCVDTVNGSAVVASGSGPSGTFAFTTTTAGRNLVCTFTNTALTPASLHTTKVVTVNGGAVPAGGVTTGDAIAYQVKVSNTGELPGATTLTATIPANTTYNGTGWTIDGSTATRTVTVAGGATITSTLTVTVGALPPNTTSIDNRVTTSSGPCAACVDSIATAAVIAVTAKLVSINGNAASAGDPVGPGDALSYEFTATNTGGTDAAPVLTDSVPAHASYTGGAAQGWTVTGAVATKTLPVIIGATVTTTLTITVDNPLQVGTTVIANSATVAPGSCACSISNPVPAYTVSITAAPGQVHPGEKVTYTILVRNNGAVDFTAARPAVVTDDLVRVLDDAKYNGDATRGGSLADTVLTWRLAVPSGAIIAITFTVTILDPDSGDQHLINVLTTPAGGNCLTDSPDPNCVANEVGLQSFTTTLSASTAVTHPGEIVTYTIVVRNTGTVDYTVLDPARFSDDLKGVLDDGTYSGDATGGATLSGGVLSWAVALPVGATVTVTYSVKVSDAPAGDHELVNSVVTANGNGGNCRAGSGDVACAPHSTGVQSYVVTVTASTSVALPGDKVTYTVTVRNTGAVDYTAAAAAADGTGTGLATVATSLVGILDDATYNNDASGGASYSPPVLAWGITLPVHATKSFTYSVTMKPAGSGDGQLAESLVTSAGGNCPFGSADAACAPTPVALRAYTVTLTADRTGATNGTVVTFQVTVRNGGGVAFTASDPAAFTNDLTQVLDDAQLTSAVPAGAQYAAKVLSWSGALAVGSSLTLVYSVTVDTPDNGDADLSNSVVSPVGKGSNCAPKSTAVACSVQVLLSTLRLDISANPVTMRDPGDVTNYTFTVTNTGRFPLIGVHLTSTGFAGTGTAPDLAPCAAALGSITPGATKTCAVSRSVSETDLDTGFVIESAQAAGSDSVDPVVSSNASTSSVTTVAPITIKVTAETTDVNADGVIDPGDRVDWVITATNTGRSALTGLSVSDSFDNLVNCRQTGLNRDVVTECNTAAYTITEADAGRAVTNTLLASGLHAQGITVTSSGASATVEVHSEPAGSSSLALAGTNARLALIIVSMLIAFGGLFVLAGHRRRRRVT